MPTRHDVSPGKAFAENLKLRRAAAGLTQAELATRMQDLGFDNFLQATIWKIEVGQREVKLDEAVALAEALAAVDGESDWATMLQPVGEFRANLAIRRAWTRRKSADAQLRSALREALAADDELRQALRDGFNAIGISPAEEEPGELEEEAPGEDEALALIVLQEELRYGLAGRTEPTDDGYMAEMSALIDRLNDLWRAFFDLADRSWLPKVKKASASKPARSRRKEG